MHGNVLEWVLDQYDPDGLREVDRRCEQPVGETDDTLGSFFSRRVME